MTVNARTSIVKALVDKFKTIDGSPEFNTNIYGNAYNTMKFWDEIKDFPAIYATAGPESRDYLPGGFKWGLLTVTIRAYVHSEFPENDLELLISDIETVVDATNGVLVYNPDAVCAQTTEINLVTIITDEGVLNPYGVGEITLRVQYQVM